MHAFLPDFMCIYLHGKTMVMGFTLSPSCASCLIFLLLGRRGSDVLVLHNRPIRGQRTTNRGSLPRGMLHIFFTDYEWLRRTIFTDPHLLIYFIPDLVDVVD